MKTFMRGTVSALLLGAVIVTGAPRTASAGPWEPQWEAVTYDAVLYELNENMSLGALRRGHRKATSQLLGFARPGSPLCPVAIANRATSCVINATGADNISLVTGIGKFAGSFTIVDQDNNIVDSPEAVLAKGRFSGMMDFSPAILWQTPLGSVDGEMALHGGPKVPFTGTFRLPFVLPLAAMYPGGPIDQYTEPMYLVPPDGTTPLCYVKHGETTIVTTPLCYVKDGEKAVGFPTVRFEIKFR
jgi:hypothetical protein